MEYIINDELKIEYEKRVQLGITVHSTPCCDEKEGKEEEERDGWKTRKARKDWLVDRIHNAAEDDDDAIKEGG